MDTNEDIDKNPSHLYNKRLCPICQYFLYGMPGGKDAQCHNCGYKDPCCSD